MSSLEMLPLSGVTGVQITGHYSTRVSETQTGYTQAQNYGGGYWEINIDLTRRSRHEHDQIFAFLHKQRGRYGVFGLQLPEYSQPKLGPKGTIKVSGIANTGSTIQVTGMPAGIQMLSAGDYVQLRGHPKVYILTKDLYSDNAGNGIMHISPNLFTTPVADSDVIYTDITWQVRNTTDQITLDLDNTIKARWSLSLREAF